MGERPRRCTPEQLICLDVHLATDSQDTNTDPVPREPLGVFRPANIQVPEAIGRCIKTVVVAAIAGGVSLGRESYVVIAYTLRREVVVRALGQAVPVLVRGCCLTQDVKETSREVIAGLAPSSR